MYYASQIKYIHLKFAQEDFQALMMHHTKNCEFLLNSLGVTARLIS